MSKVFVPAAVIVGCLAIGSCTRSDTPDVASLTSGGASPAAHPQAARADAMGACLAERGIAVLKPPLPDGEVDLYIAGTVPWELCFDDGSCHMGGGADVPPDQQGASQKVMDDLAVPYKNADQSVKSAYLVIGSVDRTEDLRVCLEQTLFTLPTYVEPVDSDQILRNRQDLAAADNKWATCARAHGLPDVADVPPPTLDDGITIPTVLLPVDIDETLLKSVLEACPNFDKEAIDNCCQRATFHPQIGFDAPGWDGREQMSSALTLDDATIQHLNHLLDDVLARPLEDYMRSLPSDAPWYTNNQ